MRRAVPPAPWRLTTPARDRGVAADRGVVAVLTALVVVVVVIPLTALVVDLGLARAVQTQAAGAADSAALAAAMVRPGDDAGVAAAVAAAKHLVAANLSIPTDAPEWPACEDPAPLSQVVASEAGSCISVDVRRKLVRVTVPGREQPSAFAGLLGQAPPTVSSTSTATWGGSGTGPGCVVCVFGTLRTGTRQVHAVGGDVRIGGDLVVTDPGGRLVGDPLHAVQLSGTYTGSGSGVTPTPVPAPPPADPYAAVAPPLVDLLAPALDPPDGRCGPGVYQDVSECTSFTSGVYVVTGRPGQDSSVTLKADAENVLLYFTCNQEVAGQVRAKPCLPGDTGARFRGAGVEGVTLTGRDLGGGERMAVMYDRGYTGSAPLLSAHDLTIVGSVYARRLTISTSGSFARLDVRAGRVVVGGTQLRTNPAGAGTVRLHVDGPTPGSAAGEGRPRLVR